MLRLVRLAKLLRLMKMSRVALLLRGPAQDIIDRYNIDLGYLEALPCITSRHVTPYHITSHRPMLP